MASAVASVVPGGSGAITEEGLRASSVPELIAKKRDGGEYSETEIRALIRAVTDGSMQQSQIGALLMAIRLLDMTDVETTAFTRAMVESGETLSWPAEWRPLVVDKHSTGGVGDKVSLVLAPALAACGCKVPMISGRGLAHTGGTLDKLESIPGFSASQSVDRIQELVRTVGCCIVSQTRTLVPADSILYAIRDVTGTVNSIPLIAASIVSKKAAEGLAALVLDIKVGRAAWSRDLTFIRRLARTLVSVSNGQGIKTTGMLTRMDSPLGHMVGNALEVIESIQCLQGVGPKPLVDLICAEGGQLLYSVGLASSVESGVARVSSTLLDGSALARFSAMLKGQGVNPALADRLCDPGAADVGALLPRAEHRMDVTSLGAGYIAEIDALECALVSNSLGAGRTATDSILDPAVGLQLHAHVGHRVNVGDVILTVHHNGVLPDDVIGRLQRAVTYSEQPLAGESSLIVDII